MSEIGFQKPKWIGGGWIVVSSIQFFLMSGIVLTLLGPLRIVLFSFVLYCILYVLGMYIYYMKSEKKKLKASKKQKHAGT